MKLFLQNLVVISFMLASLVLLFIVGKWIGSLLTNDEVLQEYAGSFVMVLLGLALGMTYQEGK